jgi:hypothetical protein
MRDNTCRLCYLGDADCALFAVRTESLYPTYINCKSSRGIPDVRATHLKYMDVAAIRTLRYTHLILWQFQVKIMFRALFVQILDSRALCRDRLRRWQFKSVQR